MKKLLILFMFCTMTLIYAQKLGDVDNNGEIDMIDALKVAQYYVGKDVVIFLESSDVNCDGSVDIIDALIIAERSVGLLTIFPCELIMDEDISWTNEGVVLTPMVQDETVWTFKWEKIAGSGTVIFEDSTKLSTTVSGIDGETVSFTLRLTATNINNGFVLSDTMQFDWDSVPPELNIGNDISWTNKPVTLNARVNDLTEVTFAWRAPGEAGKVIFDDKTIQNPTVSGLDNREGGYTIELLAIDAAGNITSDTLVFNWDKITPSAVYGVTGKIVNDEVNLDWNAPVADYAGVLILRNYTQITSVPEDGKIYSAGEEVDGAEAVYEGSASSFTDSDVYSDEIYYYKIFAYDKAYNYAVAAGYDTNPQIQIAYVSPRGYDYNTGFTKDSPKKTIQAAINAIFFSEKKGEVHVARGTYDESITIRECINLYGGYNSDWSAVNFTDRENPDFETVIDYTGDGSAVKICNIAESTIRGFTIISPDIGTAGVNIENSNPTIEHNTISGVNGIFNTQNSISTIRYNIIKGAGGNYNYAVYNTDLAAPVIYNNIIAGGDNSARGTYGIYNHKTAAVIIRNNTIDGGSGHNSSYGIYLKASPGIIIENNIIFTSGGDFRYGIYEYSNNDPGAVRNNNFFDCHTLYYDAGETLVDVFSINSMDGENSSGNVALDPDFSDRVSGDLRPGGAAPINITAGGLNLSLFFTDDYDQASRTTGYFGKGFFDPTNANAGGWTMGAYEVD